MCPFKNNMKKITKQLASFSSKSKIPQVSVVSGQHCSAHYVAPPVEATDRAGASVDPGEGGRTCDGRSDHTGRAAEQDEKTERVGQLVNAEQVNQHHACQRYVAS